MAEKTRCKAKTKKGKRCRNGAVVDGVCLSHAPRNVKDERGFGGSQEGSGRPRLPRPHEVLREKIEADIESWLAPLIVARGKGKPIKTWDGKQHKIIYVDDPELGMKATKLAFSLVYGKPRQPLEITGEDGGAIELETDLADPAVKEALFDVARAIDARRRGT